MLRLDPRGFTARMLLWSLIVSSLWSSLFAQYDPPADYYNSANGLTGSALRTALNNRIKGHTKLSYANTWNALQVLDENPANTGHIRCIYTNVSIPKADRHGSSSASVLWNREHSWPKSYGFNTESWPAYTDLHHLYASEMTINSTRNDRYFDTVTSGNSYAVTGYPDKFNRQTGNLWEAWDGVKGDLARSMFYMEVRYVGAVSNEPNLYLNNTAPVTGQPRMAMLNTLLAWHVQDPVDDRERRRNHIIYTNYQGNRNPFIDRPDFVCAIWGGTSCNYPNTESLRLSSGVTRNGSATQGNYARYQIEVPTGATQLRIQFTGGSGDPDLYLRRGSAPTTSTYDFRSWNSGPVETITVTNPQAGMWHVAGYGYSSGTSTFVMVPTVTLSTSGGSNPTPTPTPTPTSTTVSFTSIAAEDGYLRESTETSNVGNWFSNTAQTFRIGDSATRQQYRGMLSFDTSSIPTSATITSASVRLYRQSVTGTPTNLGSILLDIRTGSFNGVAAMENADFAAGASVTSGGTLPYPSSNGNVTATLTTAGRNAISKTGRTQIKVRFSTDDDNDSVADYITFYSGDVPTVSYRPVLTVTYTN